MEKMTIGKIISIHKMLWLKVNTKSFRKGSLDGALFPHVIKVEYSVNEKTFSKLKWLSAYTNVPMLNSEVKVIYNPDKPSKASIIL